MEERIKGEDNKESRSLRGPYLARLELMHRLRERGCPEESLLGKTHTHTHTYILNKHVFMYVLLPQSDSLLVGHK